MDIREVKELLTELDSIGIVEVALDPIEGGTQIRGTSRNRDIVVFYDLLDLHLSDYSIGVGSVKGLLSRMQLFDEDKAKVEILPSRGDEVVVGSLNIKQGRKKATYRCSHHSTLLIPKKLPCDVTLNNPIRFDKTYVEYLKNAISSMSHTGDKAERIISVEVESGDVTLTIFDGEDDSFVDVTEKTGTGTVSASRWDVAPFQKLLNQSLFTSLDEHATFGIEPESGIAVFKLAFFDALVPPVINQ